jgi:hypothetical protein
MASSSGDDISIVEEVIPDELLALLLSFLVPSLDALDSLDAARLLQQAAFNIARSSRVNRRWNRVASDTSIWAPIIQFYASMPEICHLVPYLSYKRSAKAQRTTDTTNTTFNTRFEQQQQHLTTNDSTGALIYDRAAAKRIAATIFTTKRNLLQGLSRHNTMAYHMYKIAHFHAVGSWCITGGESEVCVWQLMPHRPLKSSSSSSSSKQVEQPQSQSRAQRNQQRALEAQEQMRTNIRQSRMLLRSAINIRGRVVVVATNDAGVAAFRYVDRSIDQSIVSRAEQRV